MIVACRNNRNANKIPVWVNLVVAAILVVLVSASSSGPNKVVLSSSEPNSLSSRSSDGDGVDEKASYKTNAMSSVVAEAFIINGPSEYSTTEPMSTISSSLSTSTVPVVQGDSEGSERPDPIGWLGRLTTAAENPRDGYNHDDWPHWSTNDLTGCTSREETILRANLLEAHYDPIHPCKNIDGVWYSQYDGLTTTNPSTFDVDHVVSLAEAHDSGGDRWTRGLREKFANDPMNLIFVSASSNRSKKEKDVAEWRPPKAVWCEMAVTVILVKGNYNLSIDSAERKALDDMARTCGEQDKPRYDWNGLQTWMNTMGRGSQFWLSTTTSTLPTSVTSTPTFMPSPSSDLYYVNCHSVRAAGKAPLLVGEPGYRTGLDRDADGVACE